MMTLEQLKENYPGDWAREGKYTFCIKYPDNTYVCYWERGFYYYTHPISTNTKSINNEDVNRLIKKKSALINFI